MARRYLPQDVFDIGAAVGATHAINGDMAAESYASQIAQTYQTNFLDDNIEEQWTNAINQLAETVMEASDQASAIKRLEHFTFFRSRYDLSRKRRRRRFFRGAALSGRREPNHERVEECLRNFRAFTTLAAAGSVPAPPSNWRPGKS